MISYIIGRVTHIDDSFIILENNGIGYKITMPGSSLFAIGGMDGDVKVHTYMAVKEDDVSLFGFLTVGELEMFKLLITVSGVGPKGAMGILSSISVDELKMAIAAEDSKLIAGAKGIGGKTAQKIVVELKGKVDKEIALGGTRSGTKGANIGAASNISEAIDALEALGFGRSAAVKAINSIAQSGDMSVSDIIGEALKVIE